MASASQAKPARQPLVKFRTDICTNYWWQCVQRWPTNSDRQRAMITEQSKRQCTRIKLAYIKRAVDFGWLWIRWFELCWIID